ncbi:MAG: TIGR02647 family protein [Pseudomonadota bacterium]|uniref:TIGR02647 family protein n=1 Tax=Gallaecimonas pentaromativorans TaxID=584787 RepID=UPI00067F20BA|nr:TIGR02647 family protein [Gallaecimonas pentaromativorans]MED5526158.1 TIGR02647 family protein [Pseudomonadota bacterium]
MAISQQLIEEIRVLSSFSLNSVQTGIKVHHDAEPQLVAATLRLFDKGLISARDGGYLTELGRETAEHIQLALTILSSEPALT